MLSLQGFWGDFPPCLRKNSPNGKMAAEFIGRGLGLALTSRADPGSCLLQTG